MSDKKWRALHRVVDCVVDSLRHTILASEAFRQSRTPEAFQHFIQVSQECQRAVDRLEQTLDEATTTVH